MRSTLAVPLVIVALITISCAHKQRTIEISRDRAVAIARAQVKFDPFEIKARRTQTNGRRAWRVELKGRFPGQPPMLFDTAVVEVDAVSGEILSVTKT